MAAPKDSHPGIVESLKRNLAEKEEEIRKLRRLLENREISNMNNTSELSDPLNNEARKEKKSFLSNSEISRYSRQLILPEIGVKGQLRLANTSVLVVGAGGLGCPVSLYLAGAGVGCLGVVDYDEVELNNLHRQVVHSELRVGMAKSASVTEACWQLNSGVLYLPYHMQLNSSNAMKLISQYDVIVDATDNVATRYLLNDSCVLANKPLVSGSALRFEGQLTVYNHLGGPCYRCLYPTPPSPETVTNCSDGGVLGVIPGIIGCLQALEVIKIATQSGTTYSQRLLLFDGLDGSLRTIKLRPRQPSCAVCGDQRTIRELIDYEQFCGAKASDKTKSLNILSPDERVSAEDYDSAKGTSHLLIDVRQSVELDICQLPGALNIPIDRIERDESIAVIDREIKKRQVDGDKLPVYVVCRLGNDSQTAVRLLKDKLDKNTRAIVRDIRGGLLSWSKYVDPTFPTY